MVAAIWKECRRYGMIYWLFVKNSLISMMEYRVNFLFGIMIEIGYLCIKLSYVYVIYRIGVDINGVSPDEIMLFVGVYTIMAGLYSTFFYNNFIQLPEHVRTGSLDMMMTKPVSLQFMATLRTIDAGYSVPNLIGGIVMVVYGWQKADVPLTVWNVVGFAGFMLIGLILTYAVFLIPQLLAFWTVKTGGVNDLSNALFDFNQMPMAIYGKMIQRAGMFVVPIFLITNLSPLYVLRHMNAATFVWGLCAPVLFLLVTRLIWKFAVRSYTSASS
jgi:ABC-2 type transport system permease protein